MVQVALTDSFNYGKKFLFFNDANRFIEIYKTIEFQSVDLTGTISSFLKFDILLEL